LFAFVALMGIWWHLGRKRTDFGQVGLALSVLFWSFSGLVTVYFLADGTAVSERLHGWTSILCLLNSLCILLALLWFRYIPKAIEPVVKSKSCLLIIGLPFLFSLLPTITKMFTEKDLGSSTELDVYFSILTLAFLGYVLWESFAKRRLMVLAWLAIACIGITFVAQVFKGTWTKENHEQPLKSALFELSENRERKIRLALPAGMRFNPTKPPLRSSIVG
jgi:hypothetical protein